MAITLNGTTGISSPGGDTSTSLATTNLSYTGTLTGGTGVIAIGTNQIYKDASGNVGIGTASPSTYGKLVVSGGSTAIDPQLTIESTAFNASQGCALNFARSGFTQPIQARISTVDNGASASNLVFSTKVDGTAGALTPRMYIDSSGNLGVGAASTGAKIDATGTIRSTAQTPPASGSGIELLFSGSIGYVIPYNRSTSTFLPLYFQASDYRFYIGGSTVAMTLDASGCLGVGPGGTSPSTYGWVTSVGSPITRPLGAFYSNTGSDSGSACIQIGKYANDSTTANIYVRFYYNNLTNGGGQINANGAGAAAFGSFSDERLKENIEDLPPQLDSILALRPTEFDYKDGSGHQIGFIAQEMEEVYPDCIGEGADGMKTITGWSKTEARLVKAIQELTTRLEALEAKA